MEGPRRENRGFFGLSEAVSPNSPIFKICEK